jgi:hypothetical protein
VGEETVELYRPVGAKELELVAAARYAAFPPRLPDQPIFYPVCNQAYAIEIASKWNARLEDTRVGYVTRFRVSKRFLDRYERHVVGNRLHEEYWIPAEHLNEFNAHLVGPIEVIGEYRADEKEEHPHG